jgi:hypothetical protein
MRTKALLISVPALVLVMLACGLQRTPELPAGALETAVAETVQAQLATFEPTDTQPSGETGTPSPTAADTPTPAPSEAATYTPTASTTPYVATDTPPARSTRTPAPCSSAIAPEFEPRLTAHPAILLALGCPTGKRQQTWAAEQRFQFGRMFWQEDRDIIHIVYDSGTFQIEPDEYVEGGPEYDCPEVGPPPASLVMPKRGFGWQWCNTAGVRDALGWALAEEMGYEAVEQEFERGHVFQNRTKHLFIYYDDGTWDYVE